MDPDQLVRAYSAALPQDLALWWVWPSGTSAEQTLAALQGRWPMIQAPLQGWCVSSQALPLSLCAPATWSAVGLAPQAPVGLFAWRGLVGLSVAQREPGALLAALERDSQAQDPAPAWRLEARDGFRLLSAPQGALAFIERDQTALLLPWSPEHEAALTQLAAWPLQDRHEQQPQHRQLRQALYEPARAFGVITAHHAALASLPAPTPQAQALRQRLVQIQSSVGLRADYDPEARRVTALIHVQDAPQEPTVVRDLRGARDELPELGALIVPGALAVLRVSAAIGPLFTLWLSTLSQPQREQLDAFERQLRDDLSIDLREALLHNLTGHMVVVVYGLNPEAFAQPALAVLRDLTSLRATREAVLWTLHDGRKLGQALDAATQLSRGRLRRQAAEGAIQYAWFDEGELRWAILLHEDYAILIDSPVAFSRAMSQVRSPQPLAASWQPVHLPELLRERDRSGLYVDLAALLPLLPEPTRASAQPWLGPLKSLLLRSDPRERASEVHVEVTLKP